MKNTPQVGDILVGFFGYDAHIADWYKVVGLTAKSVKLIGLRDNRKYTHGPMDWISTPADTTSGLPQTRRFTPVADGDGYFVKTKLTRLYPWNGTPMSCYNYH
jgi:hypothetical protein